MRIVGSGEEVTAGQIPFTPRAKKVLELALREALSLGHNYIGTQHILLGLVRENEGVAARILLDFDADSEKIRNEVIRMLSGPASRQRGPAGAAAAGPGGAAGDAKKSSKLLDQFGRNLTKLAADGKLDPVVGRETEIERIMQILSRRTKNNPVLELTIRYAIPFVDFVQLPQDIELRHVVDPGRRHQRADWQSGSSGRGRACPDRRSAGNWMPTVVHLEIPRAGLTTTKPGRF